MLNQLDFLTSKIVAKRAERSAEQAVLVGVSGIDAGGKGFISEKIAQRLQESGWRVATINADDWLNLPEVCLSQRTPGEHFYSYEFRKIDIVLLEGIFLFKPAYRGHFDLTAWVDCSFATALKRAVTRCQEGLSPAETIRAFTTIYFPAQRIHFARANPQGADDFIIRNDNASRIHAKG